MGSGLFRIGISNHCVSLFLWARFLPGKDSSHGDASDAGVHTPSRIRIRVLPFLVLDTIGAVSIGMHGVTRAPQGFLKPRKHAV